MSDSVNKIEPLSDSSRQDAASERLLRESHRQNIIEGQRRHQPDGQIAPTQDTSVFDGLSGTPPNEISKTEQLLKPTPDIQPKPSARFDIGEQKQNDATGQGGVAGQESSPLRSPAPPADNVSSLGFENQNGKQRDAYEQSRQLDTARTRSDIPSSNAPAPQSSPISYDYSPEGNVRVGKPVTDQSGTQQAPGTAQLNTPSVDRTQIKHEAPSTQQVPAGEQQSRVSSGEFRPEFQQSSQNQIPDTLPSNRENASATDISRESNTGNGIGPGSLSRTRQATETTQVIREVGLQNSSPDSARFMNTPASKGDESFKPDVSSSQNSQNRNVNYNEVKPIDTAVPQRRTQDTSNGDSGQLRTLDSRSQSLSAPNELPRSTQSADSHAAESFAPRRETGVQLPDAKQSTGRSEGGAQLPDTKQSSGRSDTGIGGASNPNIRPDARNDANTAKLPDAKTLAGLDQKFGDKVNPPGSGGIPVVAPGLPDIFGGFKGDKDSRPGKTDPGVRDGKDIRAEGPTGKDSRGDLGGSKDGKSADGKSVDVKTTDAKVADGKAVDGKPGDTKVVDNKGADGRNLNPENKSGSDGGPVIEGGSNLVHEGGSSGKSNTRTVDGDGKSVGNRGDQNAGGKPSSGDTVRTDASGKPLPADTVRTDASGKPLPGDTVRTDASGKPFPADTVRTDASGKPIPNNAVRTDASGKPLPAETGKTDVPGRVNPTDTIRTDASGKLQPQDKGHEDRGAVGVRGPVDANTAGRITGVRIDANQGTTGGIGQRPDKDAALTGKSDRAPAETANNPRGDKAFVLPPGSLPVPDIMNGIRNVRQNLDPRIGRLPSAEDSNKGARLPERADATKIDGGRIPTDSSKTVVTGGIRPADPAGRNASDVIRTNPNQNEGVKTAITSETGKFSNTPGAKQTSERVPGSADVTGDGRVIPGRNPPNRGDVPLAPPPSVQFGEMIGNLKAIASKIFPQDARPGAFDNGLPGRKTERLDSNIPGASNQKVEPIIPFNRALGGERDVQNREQFVIRLPEHMLQNKITPANSDARATQLQRQEITPDASVSASNIQDRRTQNSPLDHRQAPIKGDVPKPSTDVNNAAPMRPASHTDAATPHSLTEKQEVEHDESAEHLLTSLELVGIDTGEIVDEEIGVPIAPLEQFGGEFERLAAEDDVLFDGDDTATQGDEQDTRYQYIVEAGDTVEMISIKVFKNVALAPLIYETNKDAIPIGMQDGRMSFILTVGMIIWLPFPKEIKAYMERTNLS